jgi:hypothetical protein
MVDARLEELGMTKVDFAKKLGYSGYGGYYDLFSGQRTALTEKKLAEIAEALGWPRDHFKDPTKTLEREEYIRREFRKYMQSDVGRSADPETHKILESMQWTGKYLPDVRLYQVLTLVMERSYTAAQVLDALALEDEDRKAEQQHLRPKKRTKAR